MLERFGGGLGVFWGKCSGGFWKEKAFKNKLLDGKKPLKQVSGGLKP